MSKKKRKSLSPNMEDYLEAIALLKQEKGVARVKDIGSLLGVKKPSVSGALNELSKEGLVDYRRYKAIEFTPRGERLARGVKRRHDTLVKFLTQVLGIDSRISRQDACRMEHVISSQTMRRLAKFLDSIAVCPVCGEQSWLKD